VETVVVATVVASGDVLALVVAGSDEVVAAVVVEG
jgi:hypothetical protein